MSSVEQQRIEQFLAALAHVSHARGRIFRIDDVCHWLQWDRAECDRVAGLMEKDGLLNRLPDGGAILTSAGLQRAGAP